MLRTDRLGIVDCVIVLEELIGIQYVHSAKIPTFYKRPSPMAIKWTGFPSSVCTFSSLAMGFARHLIHLVVNQSGTRWFYK